MSKAVKTFSGTTLTLEQMGNAASAIETIAHNNKQLLEHHYGTSASDVLAMVNLARAHWYQLSNGREK